MLFSCPFHVSVWQTFHSSLTGIIGLQSHYSPSVYCTCTQVHPTQLAHLVLAVHIFFLKRLVTTDSQRNVIKRFLKQNIHLWLSSSKERIIKKPTASTYGGLYKSHWTEIVFCQDCKHWMHLLKQKPTATQKKKKRIKQYKEQTLNPSPGNPLCYSLFENLC